MILNSPTISGSLTVTGNILTSGSITLSGSIASASYALSASNAQTASFANAFTVAGNLTAQTLVVQTITSSVDFVTGSTRFGSLSSNTHTFTGSVYMNTNGLFVSSSGLVGIGTTPSIKLSVRAADAPTSPTLGASSGHFIIGNGASAISYGLMFGVNGDGHSWIQSQRVDGTATAYNILLNPQGGNVGIGTSTPSQKLEVVGGEIKAGRIDSSNEGGQISFGRSTDNATGYYIDVFGSTSTPDLRFVDVSNSAVRMTLTGTGNVLIGTTSDNGTGAKLQVDGFIDGTTFSASRTLTVNANNEKKSGMYRWNSDSTNLPESGFFSVVIYGNGDNVVAQMATHFQNANTYVRAFNTSWTAWRRII